MAIPVTDTRRSVVRSRVRRYMAATLVLLLLLLVGGLAWSRRPAVADPTWPQAARRIVDPESGSTYRLERLFIDSGRERIAATLIRPDSTARVPLMVTVTGSGDGLLPTEGPLQRRLVRRGVAVLTLGKPGVGALSGNWRNPTFGDRADNARAALDWAIARPDLDAAHTILYGHSQGGYVIPLLAGDVRVAGLILAAGPAQSVREQIATERYQTAVREGRPEPNARASGQRLTRVLDVAPSGCGLVAYHYLCHIYRFDSASTLAAVRKPVLALFGANDPLVPPSANLEHMRQLLAGSPDARLAVLPQSNHQFWESVSGLPSEYEQLIGAEAQFAYAREDDVDHRRLRRAASNRVRFAVGYFEQIDAFVERYVVEKVSGTISDGDNF